MPKRIEKLASRVKDWPEKALVGAFIGGLKVELAAEIRVYRLKSYSEAIELVRIRDHHLANLRRSTRYEPRRSSASTSDSKNAGTVASRGLAGANNRSLLPGVKRITWEEMQKRREKGLCFNCDEKFTPGHKCKTKQAFLIDPGESESEQRTIRGNRRKRG